MVIDSGEQIRKLAMKEIKARKSLKRIDTLILIVAMAGISVLMIYGSLFFIFRDQNFTLMWLGLYLFMSSMFAWAAMHAYVYIKFIKRSGGNSNEL